MDYIDFLLHGCGKKKDRELLKCERKADPPLTSRPPPGRASAAAAAGAAAAAKRRAGERTNTTTSSIAERKTAAASGGRRGGEGRCSRDQAFPETASSTREVTTGRKEEEKLRRDVAAEWRRERMKELLCVLRRANRSGQTIDSSLQKHIIELSALKEQPHRFPEREILDQLVRERLQQKSSFQPDKIAHLSKENLSLRTQQIPTPSHRLCSSSSVLCSSSASSSTSSSLSASCVSTSTNSSSLFSRGKSDNLNAAREQQLASAEDLQQQLQERRQQLLRLQAKQERERALAAATAAIDCASRRKKTRKKNITFFMPVAGRVGGLFYTPAATSLQRNSGCYNSSRSQCTAGAKPYNSFSALANSSSRHADPYSGSFTPPLKISVFSPKQQQQHQQHRRATPAATEGRVKAKKQEEIEKEEEYINSSHLPAAPLRRTLDRQYIIRSKHTHVTTYNHNSSRKSSNSSRSGTSSSSSNDSSSTNDSSSSNSNDSSTLLKGVNGIPRPAKRWVGRKLVVERRTGESTVVYNPFKNAREGTAAAQAAAAQAATATAATTPAETAAAAVVDVGGDENEEEEEEEEATRHIREKREKRERTPSVCSAAWKTTAAHPATPPRAVAAARIAAGTAASPAGSGAGRAARTVVAAAAASSGEGSDSSTTAEAAVSGMKTGEWLAAAGGGAAAAEKVTPAAAATAAASATAALKRKGKSKQRDHRRLVGASETKGTRKEAIEQMKDEQQIRKEQGCVVRARGAAVIVEERNIEEDLQSTAAEASCLPNGVGAAGGNIISCIATPVAKDITFPQIENRERTEKVDNLVLNSVVAEAAAGERERCFTSSCYSVSASAKAGAAASTLLTTVPSFLAAANRAHLLTSLKSAAPEAGAVEALAGAAGGERASQAGAGELPETIVMTAQVITAEAAAAATEAVAEEAVAKTATALVEEATEAATAIAEAVPAKRAAAEAMSAETAATDSQAAVFEVTATKAIAAEEAIAAESGGAEAVAAEIIAAAAAPEATAATLRVVFQSSENVSCGSLQAATSLFSAHGGAAAEKPVFIASPISGIKKTKGQIEDWIVTAAETNACGHLREEAAGGPMSCPAASTVFPPSARDIYTPAVKAARSVYRQAKRQISPAEGGKAEEQEDTAGDHHIEQQQQQQKKLGLSEQQQQQHFLSYTSLHEQTQQTNEQQIQQQVQDPKLTGSVLSATKQQQQEQHQQQEQRQQQQTERPEQPEQQHEEPHEWKQQHEQQQQQRLPQHQQQQQDSRQEQEEGEEEVQQQEQQEEQQREREKIIFSFLEAHRSHQQEEHIQKHPEKRNVDISSLHQKRPPLSSWSSSVSQQWSCSSPTHEHQQLQLARAAQQVIPSTVTCSPSEHHHHQQQKTSSVGSVMLEQGAVPVAAASPPPPIVLAPVPDHSAAAGAAAVLVESVATCAAVAPDVAVQDGDSISAVTDLVLAGANAAVTPLHAQQTVMPTKNKKLVLQQGPYLAASSPPMLLPLPGTAERAIAAKEEVKKSNLQASGVSNVTQCLSFSSLVSGSNARNKSLLPSQGQVEKAFFCGDEKRAQSCCTVDMNAEEQPQQQQAAATAPLFAVSSSSSVSSAPLDSHVVRDSSTAVQQLISTNKEVATSRGDVTATTTTSNRGSSTAAAHDKASSSTADSSLLAEDRPAGAADDSPAADRSVGVTSVNDASSAALAVASLAAFFKSTISPDAACLPAPVATVKSSPTASSTERFGLPALPEKAADPAAAYSLPPPAAAPDASAASTPSPTRAGIVPRSAAASVTTLPQAAASATSLPLSAVASVASLPSSAAASAASLPPRPAAASCAASPLPSPAVSGASLPSRPAAASCAASLPSPDADSAARPSLHVSPASLPRPEAASAASAAAHFRLGTAVTTPVAGASSSVSLPPHSAAKSPAPLPRRAAVSASTTTPPRHAAACGRGGLRLPASAGRSLPHVAAACTPSPIVPCVSMSSAAGGMPAGKPPSPGKAQTPLTAAAARRANVCDSETRPNHPLVYSARAASRRIREEQEAASESRKRRKLLSEVSCKEKTATSEGFVRITEVSVKGNTSPEEKTCGERFSLKEKGQLGTTQHSTTCQQLQSEQPQQQQVRQHTNSHKRQQQLNLPPSTARSGTRKISPAAQTIDFLDAVLDKSATVPFLPVGLQQQPSRQQQREQQKQRLQPRESQRVSRQEQQPAEQIENVRGSRCVAGKTRVDTGIFTCLASALNAAAVVHTESGSSSTTTGSPTRHRSNISSLVTNNTFFADSRGAMLVTTAKIQRGGARSGPGKTELDSVRAKSGLLQEPLLRAHSTKLSHNAPVARGAAGNPPFTPVKHRQTSIPGASADCADSAGGCEAEIKTSGQIVRYHNINIGDGLSAARSSSCVFSKRGALSSGTASRLHVASALPMKRNSAGGRNVSHLENTHVTTAVHSGAAIARRRDLAAANLPLRTAAGGSCEDRPRKEFCSGFTRAVAPPQAGTPCSMQTRFPPGERREDKKRMSVPFELSQRRFCPSSIKQPHNKNNTPAARLDRHSVAHRHESGASLALKVARKQKAKSASIISEDERSVDEEDEWSESDYDFIDNDTENVTGEMEENNWQEEMRTVTRYDPRNYRDLDAEECEESNFDRVYAEELFSSKVGQREDDEEMQVQQLKLEKSRHKKRKKDRAC